MGPEHDFVGGTGWDDLDVHIWVHGVECSFMITTPDEFGDWGVDFDDAGFDLVPGTGGRAEQVDGDDDATAVDWYIPVPRMVVQITEDWIWAQNSGPNSTVTFSVYDAPGGGPLIDPVPTLQVDENGEAFLGLWDYGLDLVPGNYVVISDGLLTKELILEALTYDLLDLTEGSLTGTAPEPYGRTVSLGLGFPEFDWGTDVASDGEGRWAAAYGGPLPLDLHTAYAEVFDDDGDASEVRPTRIEAEVGIDIRPWTRMNLEACGSRWDLLPVAVLSTGDFDATAVDHDTVRFGRTGTEATVVTFFRWPMRYARDVNGDGLRDMVYTFRFGDTGFSCADIPRGRRYANVVGILTASMGDFYLQGRDNLTLFRPLWW